MCAVKANQTAGATPSTTPEDVEALLEAARYGDMDDVVSLSSNGVPLDSKDDQSRTALHMAAANGHIDIVEYLISKGVVIAYKLSGGGQPLPKERQAHTAEVGFELVSLRTEDKVPSQDLNAPNEEKNTPLHWACLNGHVEVVKKLIMAGADVSALNSHERTPMDEAVSREKLEVMDAINEAVALVELRSAMVST